MVKLGEWIGRRIGMGRAFKFFFNLSPMYRSTGGRIVSASENLDEINVKLKLNYKTRNYVGTMYGGHMYSSVDGIYMVQLIHLLGKEYVVWDKAATIKFKRPGTTALYAHFKITEELIEKIKTDVAKKDEIDLQLDVDLVNADGKACAEVEKVIYIASKSFYKEKQREKNTQSSK